MSLRTSKKVRVEDWDPDLVVAAERAVDRLCLSIALVLEKEREWAALFPTDARRAFQVTVAAEPARGGGFYNGCERIFLMVAGPFAPYTSLWTETDAKHAVE